MTREEARKLLSGYATGSLTELEQQLLFDAALEDQELFDELADEQAVKELVELPGAKRRLMLALGPEKKAVVWWPWAAGVAVVATISVAVWVAVPKPGARVEVAAVDSVKLERPATAPAVSETPAPTASNQQAVDMTSRKATTPESEPAKPELSKDAVAEAVAAPQPTVMALADKAKAGVRDEISPVPNQLESRAKQNLPILTVGQLGQQGGKGAALLAPVAPPAAAVPQAFLSERQAVAVVTGGALTYEVRNTGILRMTPSRSGVLEVTFDGRPLYPSRPVVGGTTIDVSIPLEAKQLRLDYAAEANAPNVTEQTGGISGELTLPTSPNPRAVIVIPAQR